MNLKGKKYGRLTCIKKSKKNRYWLCKCDCGNEKEIRHNHLTMGKIISCAECPIFELPGKKFGKLTVIQYVPGTGGHNRSRKFKCLCDCGKETYTNSTILINQKLLSCGRCVDRNELEGEKFGYLKVLNYQYEKIYTNSLNTYWKCQCDCGQIKIVSRCNLVTGAVQSCGCKRFVEGSMQGERGKVNVLKEEDVIQIRKFWAEELIERKATGEHKVNHTQQSLADRYYVSTTTIHHVIHSRSWFFLPPVDHYVENYKQNSAMRESNSNQ